MLMIINEGRQWINMEQLQSSSKPRLVSSQKKFKFKLDFVSHLTSGNVNNLFKFNL